MNAWTQTIPLFLPLRDARLASKQPSVARPVERCATSPVVEVDEQKLQEREQAAYQRGRAEGERVVRAELEAQRQTFEDFQKGLFASLRGAIPRAITTTEDHLVVLAFEVAQKLVAGLPITTAVVEAAIHEALSQVEKNAGLVVSVHPEDLALLQSANSPLLQQEAGEEPIQFRPSTEVSRGGCIVHTNFGTLDARRETKVELLKKSLQL